MGSAQPLVAAIDCGTTQIKAGIFQIDGRILSSSTKPCKTIFFPDGRIEQDGEYIVKQTFSCLAEAIKKGRINPERIHSVSVANQRATICPLKADGKPTYNAISWQDMRGLKEVESFRRKIPDSIYQQITGLSNNPVFSLAKILWLKKNKPRIFHKTAKFALVQDLILNRLGCDGFYTDFSNASLTGYFDINKMRWSSKILSAAGIPSEKLPETISSGECVGHVSQKTSKLTGVSQDTMIIAGGGDQQCAALGSGACKPGIVEVTLGTAVVTVASSKKPVFDSEKRVACCVHAVPRLYGVEGLQNSGGASLSWISEVTYGKPKLKEKILSELEKIKPSECNPIYYPHLAGASAPNWNPKMRGTIIGLQYRHKRFHVIKAVLEGISYETKQVLDVFKSLRIPVDEIRLTGGCSKIGVWNQIQANIYGKRVSTLKNPEATLCGAAILASYGIGLFNSVEKASASIVQKDRTYKPGKRESQIYQRLYKRYCTSYNSLEEVYK